MSASESVKGWGPQDPLRRRRRKVWWIAGLLFLALVLSRVLEVVIVVALLAYAVRAVRARSRSPHTAHLMTVGAGDPLATAQSRMAAAGGGVYLGEDRGGQWRCARPERGVLLLGPPRSGKTSAVILPALLAHDGPAVSTSTKPDVLAATGETRGRLGRVWSFDPSGAGGGVGQALELRWSPVSRSVTWDGALLTARSMVLGAGVGHGATDSTHWAKRAQALLAALMHAAAISGVGIGEVQTWVLSHELDAPGAVLEQAGAGRAAVVLLGLANTEPREQSSIFSSCADALDAYSSDGALAAAADPNFDAARFVRSQDTIYIHAPADQQQLVAPLVCGLLSEIRAATYRAHAHGEIQGRVLFALDEVANIAPLTELPAIASEGGGQGLVLLAALQDLSQARARWGAAADGFLTLFGSKLILPGIADQRTLETVSVALGEYDREMESHTRKLDFGGGDRSRTVSIQRQRVISPGDVANIPAGCGLHLDGVNWELISLTPAFAREPWRSLIGGER
jgi:type IV secretion system protein VirD4